MLTGLPLTKALYFEWVELADIQLGLSLWLCDCGLASTKHQPSQAPQSTETHLELSSEMSTWEGRGSTNETSQCEYEISPEITILTSEITHSLTDKTHNFFKPEVGFCNVLHIWYVLLKTFILSKHEEIC